VSAASSPPPREGEPGAAAASPAGTGPGHLLRSAREAAGMSVRDVSAQLRLDERTIAALESDDFSGLPAPTFVRGYLRGYARLLGVPVGPVMEAYDREGFTPPDLVADIAEKPQANTGDFPVRLTTALVAAVLVVLVVMWWDNQSYDEVADAGSAPPAAAAGAPAPGATARAPDAMPPDGDQTPGAGAAAAPADPVAGGGDAVPAERGGPRPPDAAFPAAADPTPPAPPAAAVAGAADAPAQAAAGDPTAAPAAAGAQVEEALARARDVLERTRDELDTLAAGPAASERPPQAPQRGDGAPGEPAAAGAAQAATQGASERGEPPREARLRMSFPVEAWVEVYDADDARLFFDLVQPGRELDLTGKPPLRVLLGRTRGVRVTWNGEPVDLTPYIEKGVARFTLAQ